MGESRPPIAIERREAPLSGVEVRADGSNIAKFRGHAAVFNTEAVIAGLWRERVLPGAFAKTIKEADVRFLFNHEPDSVMARTTNGTLRLSEDDKGLLTEADLDRADWDVQRLLPKLAAGNVTQMSYAFRVISDMWDEEPEDGGLPKRGIKEAQLFDTSPATFPAFETTDAELLSVRSLLRARPDVCQIVDAKAAAEYLQTSSANEPKETSAPEGPQKTPGRDEHPRRIAPRYRDLVLEQYRP